MPSVGLEPTTSCSEDKHSIQLSYEGNINSVDEKIEKNKVLRHDRDMKKEVGEIIELLEKAGFSAYAVGGSVRDSLLKKKPQDWDITTSASPEEIQEVSEISSFNHFLKKLHEDCEENKEDEFFFEKF